jgi:serine/threonine protein kinase
MFLELLRRSRLIEPAKLDEYLRQRPHFPERPDEAAAQLVHDGFLTRYQAQVLMSGRWKGFFLGSYKILKPLGKGGMSTVFLAEHVTLHRKVALKVLPGRLAADPATLERFYREGRVVAALDHPNLVRAYDIGHDDDVHFLVMEYVEGRDLGAILAQKKPVPVDYAVACIVWAATGLQHAFAKGLIHRDIKPANLILSKQGGLKILDMGLARFFLDEADDLTRRFQNKGLVCTPDYASPEQTAQGSNTVDIRSDIYSLGCTFYALLTGAPPFTGSMTQILAAHQSEIALPVSVVRKEVPDGLSGVVARMMAKKPEDRYQTPAEVLAALEPWTPTALVAKGNTDSSPFFAVDVPAAEEVDTEPDDGSMALTLQVDVVAMAPAAPPHQQIQTPPPGATNRRRRSSLFVNWRFWVAVALTTLLFLMIAYFVLPR